MGYLHANFYEDKEISETYYKKIKITLSYTITFCMLYYKNTTLGGEHMTTTIYSFEDISTQKFLSGMVKGVLGTHYLQPDKFPLFYTDPPVGRTFVADRLKMKCPIDWRVSEKLYVLFKYIFEGKSNYELVPLTERFSRQFASLLGMEIEFLRIYSDDTEEMRRKKGEYLLMLWKEVVDKFIDKVFVPINQFQSNQFTLLREIFTKMKDAYIENTYTDNVRRRWEKKIYEMYPARIRKEALYAKCCSPVHIWICRNDGATIFVSSVGENTVYVRIR